MRVPDFFRNPDPGRLVVAQRPNLPLAIYLLGTGARVVLRPDGTAGTALSAIATAGLAWWAVSEILDGDSPFRRVLGAAVLGAGVVSRLGSG